MASYLELSNLHKHFGAVHAIDGVNLDVQKGEFVVFVGPSGCGKSTLLRMIAGLEDIDTGAITLDNREITELPSSKRDLAMVFQSYALYPHMSVFQNMSFALQLAGTEKATIKQKVNRAAEILDLSALLERMPSELSGGQRQRVAIGRAIVRDPKVFLFDEPLSNLDASLRGQTRVEIARLHRDLGATTIYVTHDQTEAMTLADRVVVMRDGRIEQSGSPLELYDRPANRFVAQFIGMPQMNVFDASQVPEISQKLGSNGLPHSQIGVRPERLSLTDPGAGLFDCLCELVESLGAETLVHLRTTSGAALVVRINQRTSLTPGDSTGVVVASDALHWFDAQGNAVKDVQAEGV